MDASFGIGRVLNIFRCPDGVQPGTPASIYPVLVTMEFGDFCRVNEGLLQRCPSASFQRHVPLASLQLLPAGIIIADEQEGR